MKININAIIINLCLTIILIALKLDGLLQWNWIWVICPIWIQILIDIVFALILGIIIAFNNRKPKIKSYVPTGKPIIWDAKTKTMHTPFGVDVTE